MKILFVCTDFNRSGAALAAGIGSRFGTGIKQLTPIDNNNHLIMPYGWIQGLSLPTRETVEEAIKMLFEEVQAG